ncbi:MAG: type IV pilus modification PilV family protein [Gammaproteobacteria bacterium]
MPFGFTLIEVLISLLILSFILLGFDAMQLTSMRENRNAYYFSMAQNQLNSMIERLHAQPLSLDQIAIWNQQNQQVLPNGTGYVQGHFPCYKITIFWGEKNHQDQCNQFQSGKINCLTTQIKNCGV